MSSMFPPIDLSPDQKGGGLDIASAFGIQLPDGISLEDFQQFLLGAHILNTGRQKLPDINTIEQVVDLIDKSSNILVLTGAGISVSAGIPDFRSENGLYATLKEKFNLTEPTTMFDMEYFIKDPSLFYSFGGDICPGFDDNKIKYYPTPTHYFIKLLESKGKLLRNYTQNIDTLEHRAGINNVITCHGSYITASCINCGFQVNGIDIEQHIFNEQIPYCPYCSPNKSGLHHLLTPAYTTDNNLKPRKPIIETGGNILKIRLLKTLCSLNYLQDGCPVLFSFSEDILQKAIFDDDELNTDNNGNENMNFKTLVLKSSNTDILNICRDCVMQWLQTEIKSFGVIKPDIVFFSEALSVNYHQTLEEDIKKCDLLLVLGTSLLVQPVSSIPKKVPSTVPAVLINREEVGYPNVFDVNLLGNCDDVVVTLIDKLKWEFMRPKRRMDMDVDNEENEVERKNKSYRVKPIDTVKAETKVVEYEFVEPNYYVFPNGTLPENMCKGNNDEFEEEEREIKGQTE